MTKPEDYYVDAKDNKKYSRIPHPLPPSIYKLFQKSEEELEEHEKVKSAAFFRNFITNNNNNNGKGKGGKKTKILDS